MSFFEVLILLMVSSIIPLAGVFLGGWLVFRTRNAQLGIPMMSEAPKKSPKSSRYVDLSSMGMSNNLVDEIEKELSPAAKRYRQVTNISDVKAAVMGGK